MSTCCDDVNKWNLFKSYGFSTVNYLQVLYCKLIITKVLLQYKYCILQARHIIILFLPFHEYEKRGISRLYNFV